MRHLVFVTTLLLLNGCDSASRSPETANSSKGSQPNAKELLKNSAEDSKHNELGLLPETLESKSAVPDNWQLMEADDKFTFKGPPGLHLHRMPGTFTVDSYAETYIGPGLELSFDYGFFSDPMEGCGFIRFPTKIDGRHAYIAKKDGMMGVHFPELDGMNTLTMHAWLNGEDPETVELIFRTVDFPE